MNLLRKTTSSKFFNLELFSFILFVVVHVALVNFNSAEWGDSYRILRASEFIRNGSYPSDEKRPPLFSAFLALRPVSVDAVIWGRVVMLIFSILSFFVFYKLVKIYIKDEKYRFIALILFTFNPVYLYWSIRVMADVPFSFFVLLAFYISGRYSNKGYVKFILLGFISGLAILTRFEGYLLFASLMLSTFFSAADSEKQPENRKSFISDLAQLFLKNWKSLLILGLTTFITITPWVLFRNPLRSSYFEETSRRTYDLKMIWTYFVSIFYSFGFTSAFYFIFSRFRTAARFLKENLDVTTFLGLELILILLWPAAIPRLFVCLIPFFIIILTLCMKGVFEEAQSVKKNRVDEVLVSGFFLLFYVVSQYFLKLQFLITNKKVFVVLVLLQVLAILFFYLKKSVLLIITILISTVVWSLTIIFSHREIYTAIKLAGIYSRDNLSGKVLFNDTTSVADWYLNYSKPRINLEGEKADFLNKEDLSYNDLLSKNVSYVITTNEDGVIFDRGIEKLEYLKLINSFRYNIGDKEFFANIFRFER